MTKNEKTSSIQDVVQAINAGKRFVFTESTDEWQKIHGTDVLSYIIVPNKEELMSIYTELQHLEVPSVFKAFYEPTEILDLGDKATLYHYIEILD